MSASNDCLPASSVSKLTAEGLVPIAHAANHLGVHPASVRRWCLRGASSASGGKVMLEHVRLPGKMLTSLAALERFTSEIGTPSVPTTPARSPAKRAKESRRAAEELARRGF